ncbi:unnamed protein product, partial [Urochloa humidicola]
WFRDSVVGDDAAVIGSNHQRSATTATHFLGCSRAVARGFERRMQAPGGYAGEGARPHAASALYAIRVKADSADRPARHRPWKGAAYLRRCWMWERGGVSGGHPAGS